MLNTLKYKNILLVEDEPDIQNYFHDTFGQKALEIFVDNEIDILGYYSSLEVEFLKVLKP